MLYDYRLRPIVDQSGTAKYAFLPHWTNPMFGLWGGATPARMQWNPTQPPQVYQQQRQTAQGLTGIIAGQMAMQPLLDTRGING